VSAAAAEIRTGQRINVSLPLDEPNPAFFGRRLFRHTIFEINDTFRDDFLDGLYLQASTNWDGFRHKRDSGLGYYNGVEPDDAGASGDRLGVMAVAQHGIIGRGVLLDVARNGGIEGYDALERTPIDRAALERTLESQGQSLRHGDILLVRTGYIEDFLDSEPSRRVQIRDSDKAPGLTPDDGVAGFLWDNRIAAVAVDNPGVELGPADPTIPDLHMRLIPMLGIIMGEFFNFRELSAACDADARYTCFFVAVPLNLRGGVGSPGNAVVIR
jgi:kynurenine formamidase